MRHNGEPSRAVIYKYTIVVSDVMPTLHALVAACTDKQANMFHLTEVGQEVQPVDKLNVLYML